MKSNYITESPVRVLLTVFLGLFSVVLLVFMSASSSNGATQADTQTSEPSGGGEFKFLPMDEITEDQRREIKEQIRVNVERLEREGRLSAFSPEAVPLSWPVAKAPGVIDFNIDGISNFVDQNLAFPNQLLDWNCGARTYDQASGYNHAGIDIFTWPFSWKKMDNNEVRIIAAAPGTIVFKSDGNFDRNCGFGSGNWNAVYIRHSDNSTAWYGHMKSGSVTAKVVGDSVQAGEFLGVVGSSGNSTGPHLHFELYNASNQLQDPYQGACNSLNNFSWWALQPEYRVPQVNRLMTQSAGPTFPACPQTETSNEKTVFRSGEAIVAAAYYRDQMLGQQTQYSIIRPDGTTYQTWSQNSPNTYSASYWWYTRTLPANAPAGLWKFRASFNSQTYDQAFTVLGPAKFDYDADVRADLSVFRPSDNMWYVLRGTAGYMAMGHRQSSGAGAPGSRARASATG